MALKCYLSLLSCQCFTTVDAGKCDSAFGGPRDPGSGNAKIPTALCNCEALLCIAGLRGSTCSVLVLADSKMLCMCVHCADDGQWRLTPLHDMFGLMSLAGVSERKHLDLLKVQLAVRQVRCQAADSAQELACFGSCNAEVSRTFTIFKFHFLSLLG
jgi:hypothetical protein